MALDVLTQPQVDTAYSTWADLRDLFFDLNNDISQHQDTHGVQVEKRAIGNDSYSVNKLFVKMFAR